MAVMEFQVTTDLTPVVSTQIETNFEAVRDWLTNELAPYATMVVTPDAIADAKKTRSAVRKVGESIDAQRKAVKKEWMRPYEEYEAKCKELTGIVGEAVANIDGQIKEMENAEKEAKRQRLENFFTEHAGDVSGFLTFEEVFNSRWLNATYAETDAAGEITARIEETRDGLTAIRDMGSPYESAMLSEFSKSHSLAKAMAEGKRLEAIQRAEDERRAQEAKAREEDIPSWPENATAPVTERETTVSEPDTPPVHVPIRPAAEREPTYDYRFTMKNMSMAQMKNLKRCLISNGITYQAERI